MTTNLTELSKNLQDAKMFESSDDEDDVNGTVNYVVLLEDCIIVGVDSRGTKKEEGFYRWKTDIEEKVKEVATGVLLTAAGYGKRKKALFRRKERQ
ncbi:hypothetical protein CASFOL_039483 [Castilleja foliolosa]|uniref:Uncharacterized protein n=1 Tax=Castilleja foliolosa TaxID=1961234 RepID=A0ABD3BIR6_9LAMI